MTWHQSWSSAAKVPGDVLLTVPALTVEVGRSRTLFVGEGMVIRAGEVCGITGPSGCGKSTLLKALGMGLPPASVVGGERMRLGGSSFAELGGGRWRAGCLSVPQSVPPITGITCLEWFRSVLQFESWGHLDARAAELGLVAAAADLGLTRQELEHTELALLSGGERHRAVLACALALEPKVLLLDEPTAALDAATAELVVQRLQRFVKGGSSAVLVVTHSPDMLANVAHTWITFR